MKIDPCICGVHKWDCAYHRPPPPPPEDPRDGPPTLMGIRYIQFYCKAPRYNLVTEL